MQKHILKKRKNLVVKVSLRSTFFPKLDCQVAVDRGLLWFAIVNICTYVQQKYKFRSKNSAASETSEFFIVLYQSELITTPAIHIKHIYL